MKIIDLSQEIYDGMPVFPGDPEVKITMVDTYDKGGWNMRRLEINSHDATHLNVPIHSSKDGMTLDDYQIEDFVGKAIVYNPERDLHKGMGVLFVEHDIDMDVAQRLVEAKVKFVGLSEKFDFNLDAERYLLKEGIISFERLANTEKLPRNEDFMFYGVPLKIREGDGSPVRAFAVL